MNLPRHLIPIAGLIGWLLASAAPAQTLPAHAPLRILIVSDEVNPHALPPAQLTQPGELSAAMASTPALNIDVLSESLVEIPTNEIEQATSRLQLPPTDPAGYDVLVYFAHRPPNNGMDDQVRQEAFVAAVSQFLIAGGGVVSFHHGIYETAGKASMQDLLGGQATGAVPWNTSTGQNVIALSSYHFVSHHAVLYPGRVPYADPGIGVVAGDYLAFNNTPDERYPNLALRAGSSGAEALFGSDYSEGGSTHLLGYVRSQASWQGVVVVYQPGEYEPNALGPGNNYQILLNAILFAANYRNGDWLFIDGFEGGSLN
jgi:hypothetical protein